MEIILRLEKQHVDVILEALNCAWHITDKRYVNTLAVIREQIALSSTQ